ncbi:bifunctional diaminohydroxyphosphoribosylaminopyrimidine deaminase/5-amino-6-(5-phosphoribosylamino)uracil reductase RibD [Ancylobacter mangrovi]|uniref:bifunctional diaminohydroxyphosphoribosylaminopyrimidine deaminase/5-amino-6-(5-phosphoribosylamino)uracil reductase RibD n=1 Tax=Ancylobacter mangrovi TaxID=2972472 RepID=UPI002867D396|nr:bifunctional diaminohydroxyphosphoribosylaminopyrimidine deaminase/5-amino-6-(5-phosphoribosylamino)uracil reductase RibD [Ancylobacter mangrovi]
MPTLVHDDDRPALRYGPNRDEARASKPPSADRQNNDECWMNEAIELARDMQGLVWPNPAVGCVIVNDGRIVGRGRTQYGGRPHAERVALNQAAGHAPGSTLYVTLEPCCHWGKTPPCVDAIIAAGVCRVVASLQDPDPRVNGGGFRKLRQAGIKVEVGPGAEEARETMAGFFHRIATGRPLVEIGERALAPSSIPRGFDAVVQSGERKLWLLTRGRRGETFAEGLEGLNDTFALLDQLGTRGLTRVYVSSSDPFAERLMTGAHA